MPWSGDGVFTRVHSWVSDRDAGFDILASRMDQDTDDIAQGLMHCLAVNGETQPLANIDMNNFRITGAAAGVNSGDYVTVDQILNGGGGLPSGGFLPLTGGILTGALQIGVTGAGAAALPLTLQTGNLHLGRTDQAYHYILRDNTAGSRNIGLAGTGLTQLDNIRLDAVQVVVTGALAAATVSAPGGYNGSGLTVTGAISGAGLQINGAGAVTGALTAGSFVGGNFTGTGLQINGAGAVTGALTAGSFVGGNFTGTGLQINGAGAVTGALTAGALTAASVFTSGTLQVQGDTSLAGNLAVSGEIGAIGFVGGGFSGTAIFASGTLQVQGGTSLAGNLAVGSSVGVGGNLTVAGTINGAPFPLMDTAAMLRAEGLGEDVEEWVLIARTAKTARWARVGLAEPDMAGRRLLYAL